MRVLLIVLAALLSPQEDPLIRQMTSGRVDERQDAVRELVRRGRDAVPALEAAARDADPDRAGRARLCLDKIAFYEQLTPKLRAIEGLAERLRLGGPKVWSVVLEEALPERSFPEYRDLTKDDWAHLASEVLRRSTDPYSLVLALRAIDTHRLETAKPAAQAQAHSPLPQIRAAAASTLIRLAGPEGMDVAEGYLGDADAGVRKAAVGAVAGARLPGAAARLAKMTSDEALSRELTEAFGRLRAPEGIPYLERACRLERWDDHSTRSWAALLLSSYAGPKQIPLFRELLKWVPSEPNSGQWALSFLGNWGDRASIPAIEVAIGMSSGTGNCPDSAARALYQMGATESTEAFLILARKCHTPQALRYLGLMGNPKAIPGLREFLDPPELAAMEALVELDDRESIRAFRKLLDHKERRIREAACSALAVFQDEVSRKEIESYGREADAARRIWPALGPIKNPPTPMTVELLLQRFKDPRQSSGRVEIAKDLAREGRREGVAFLLENDYVPVVLNALRKPALWKALHEKHAPIRLYAPYQTLHERLAQLCGLKLEGPPEGCDERKAWTDVYSCLHRWGTPLTLTEAFEMIEEPRWSVVFEEDRIRILPRDEARAFWARWAAGEEK